MLAFFVLFVLTGTYLPNAWNLWCLRLGVGALQLGATALVKLALQELFVFLIKNIFGSASYFYAYAMLRQSVAGMLTVSGIIPFW